MWGTPLVVLVVGPASCPTAVLGTPWESCAATTTMRRTPAAGGFVGAVIMMGVRRGAFSNEAGIGTESMAHGAAKTNQPIREGIVAMMGPVIDTLLVCSCTALTILVTDVWQETDLDGVTLTAAAFEQAVPDAGAYLLLVMVFFLGFSTILAMWYYGSKCLGFLVGAEYQRHYIWFYLMLLLAPRVNAEAQRYFAEKHHLASELISGSR